MNLALWLERSAAIHGSRLALAHGERPFCDYAGLARRAAATARRLADGGLAPGDRVAFFMANHPDYVALLWGVWWGGFVAVPINAKLHAREAAWILGHSGARLVFCDIPHGADLAPAIDEAKLAVEIEMGRDFLDDEGAVSSPAARSEDDAAWLFYTSGTTGRPKGVTLANRQLRWMTYGYHAMIRPVTPTEVMLHPAPLSHGGGLYHLPYVMHGALNVVPASGGFDPAECLALAAHWRDASFFAAPTMVRRLIDEAKRAGRRPEGLGTITYGGGPMYLADILEGLEVIGPHFAQIYGQGESPMTITALPSWIIADRDHPCWRERLASVGCAQGMCEVAIKGDDGGDVPLGAAGEVCVRGEIVMNGYWNDPAATAKAIRDGWLWTGDVGRLDSDGFLTLLDRSKDLIISGGTNIYPREVEEALLLHPAVAEVAVIGRKDAEWGEIVVAFVVAGGTVDPATLDAHCLSHIARFKRPKVYRLVAELPKNNYGKVLKTALRDIDATMETDE